MHKVEHHVGRLVETRLGSPVSVEEVQEFLRELTAILTRLPGKYVGVADLREAHVFTPEVADSLIKLLSASSPRVERSAMLIGESATFALQVERVIRSANSENRRSFRTIEELETWLDDVLTVEERVQLRRFFVVHRT